MFEDNPSFTSVKDIAAICQPAMKSLNLTYYGFCRIYANGDFFNLSTDVAWPKKHYIEDKLPPAGHNGFCNVKSQILLPTQTEDSKLCWRDGTIKNIKERFGIQKPVFVIKKFTHHADLCVFNFNVHNPYEFFFNQHERLTNFIFYFKDKAQPIIEAAEKHPLKLPSQPPSSHCEAPSNIELDQQLTPESYELFYQGIKHILSKKSFQILRLSSKGLSNSQIAEQLFLSTRTIEGYIEKIKNQFNVSKKSCLYQIFDENNYF